MRKFLLILCLASSTAFGQEPPRRTLESLLDGPPERASVPEARDLEEAEQLLKEVYGAELEKARNGAQKAALAQKLLNQAKETQGEAAGRYALIRRAITLASESGDVECTSRAIDALRLSYKVEVLPIWVAALESLSKEARTAADRKMLVETALSLIDHALSRDDFATANSLSQTATVAARGAQDASTVRVVATRLKTLKDDEKEFAAFTESKRTLATSPTDPAANQLAGKYTCLVKGDWETGLSMLVLGGDAALKKAAELDIAAPQTAEGQVAAGDAWWSASSAAKDPDSARLKKRARYWYEKALPTLTGLAKAKVAKRLEELAGAGPETRKSGPSDLFPVGSVWVSDEPRRTLTVTERQGEMFRARFQIGTATEREVVGIIRGNRVSWLAKDAKAIKGDGVGGDNHGAIIGGAGGPIRIDFVHGLGKTSGTFTLVLRDQPEKR